MKKFKDIIQSDKPVLVDFYATWYEPCKTMHLTMDKLRNTIKDKACIEEIDINVYDGIAQFYRILMVPTLIIFKKGEVLWRHSGSISEQELQTAIEQFL